MTLEELFKNLADKQSEWEASQKGLYFTLIGITERHFEAFVNNTFLNDAQLKDAFISTVRDELFETKKFSEEAQVLFDQRYGSVLNATAELIVIRRLKEGFGG